jgi:hypothetical protein
MTAIAEANKEKTDNFSHTDYKVKDKDHDTL